MPLAVGMILILSPLPLAEPCSLGMSWGGDAIRTRGLQSAFFGFVLVLGLGSGNSSYQCGYIRCPLLCRFSSLGVISLSSLVTPCMTLRVSSCAS